MPVVRCCRLYDKSNGHVPARLDGFRRLGQRSLNLTLVRSQALRLVPTQGGMLTEEFAFCGDGFHAVCGAAPQLARLNSTTDPRLLSIRPLAAIFTDFFVQGNCCYIRAWIGDSVL